MDKGARIRPFLDQLTLFAQLPQAERSVIADNSAFERVKGGHCIFREGDAAAGGYFLATGKVVMKKATYRGKDLITELIGPKDPFGIVTAAQGKPYPLSALALSESVILRIEQSALEEAVRINPGLMPELLAICSERVRNVHELAARLADASTEVRIVAALLLLAKKFGESSDDGIDLVVTRQELSALAGTRVETCIRLTREMEEEGCLLFPKTGQIRIADQRQLESKLFAS